MPLPLDTSEKAGIVRRVKALGVLSLPFLAFAVVVFLASALVRIHPAAVREKASQQSANKADGWLFANSASSADATVEVSQTSVEASGKPGGKSSTATTYVVTGTY